MSIMQENESNNKALRILFLDDNHERHKKFSRAAIGCHVDKAYSAQEAIRFLESNNDYDLVMLDHDLGEDQAFDEENGRVVASWIAENMESFLNTTFVIHSLNEAGSVAMASIIGGSGLVVHRIPFAWNKFVYSEIYGVKFS